MPMCTYVYTKEAHTDENIQIAHALLLSKYNRNNPTLFSEAERGLQSGSFVELAAAPDPDALCVSLPGMGQSLVLTERRIFNDQETAIGAGGPAEEGQMEDIFLTSTMC